jgi:uncharacterized protein YqjF (DUF2071 family)
MTPEGILASHAHRPWPLPNRKWRMVQEWNRLLFAHWPVDPPLLRPLVPPVLELDLREGRCWVAVTPFYLSGLRLRGLPAVPGTSSFLELNLRTYVRYQGVPGVFFFSLDAGSLAAVFGAHAMYGLPYFYASMRMRVSNQGAIHYDSFRAHPGNGAEFRGDYQPTGDVFQAAPGSLEQFLVERYCLYSVQRRRLHRAEIHHLPWPLQPARAEITRNTMAEASGIALPDTPPLLHYARHLQVLVWAPQRLL